MRWHPAGFGGDRRPPEEIKREGWREQGLLVVSPTDPAAILAFKDQLKLTEAQTAQLEAINKEAQDKAVAVLTADQKTMLDAVPDSPQAMNEMRRQRMGCWMMCCPMMKTDSGDSTQPEKDQPATPQNQEAHP